MIRTETPLAELPAFKKSVLGKLKHLDISTVGDLLFHLPHRYEDYSEVKPIGELTPGELCTVLGRVKHISAGQTFKKRVHITEAIIDDGTGTIRAIWFGNRFIAATLVEGSSIRLSGKVSQDKKGFLFQTPDYERATRVATHTARLIPVYPETAGITSRFFRWQITEIMRIIDTIPDPIPEDLLKRIHLPSLSQAIHSIHFPENENDWRLARKRFAWDEMFIFQLKALEAKSIFDTAKAIAILSDPEEIGMFVKRLPFTLTRAQEESMSDILADLAKPRPMNRLLNGDVGSGKTIVAAVAARTTAQAGFQTAILAPTEVLARQHWESLSKLFRNEPPIALLTRAYQKFGNDTVKKATLVSAIKAGIPKIVIGTHAVLEENIRFSNLALIIVDEQHRFGVEQRAYLQSRADKMSDGLRDQTPHFLTMTATPIPRTLALAFFGDLDLSVLDEMPKSRKSIKTKIARNHADREIVYEFIRKEVKRGRQVFVISPLVEESEALEDVKAATVEAERLRKDVFPDLRISLVHGKLKSKEKETVMEDFRAGKSDILVATSVIEVGIDIPNASVILIENAERFGLAQLHQFRGRVGRAEHQSYCFLFPGEGASPENLRLDALEKSASGFEIAEADLALRGPGSFFGTRQSGLPDVAMENITNLKLVELARKEAGDILATDPSLEHHPLLRAALARFEAKIHLE
jgi:ATP-dependent DNA helicase RecG